MMDRVNLFHPRRAAMAEALARAIPIAAQDAETLAERKLVRRMDHREAVRK